MLWQVSSKKQWATTFFDYVSFMTGSKYQEHYFGGLVIGQSSKIMFLIFLRWHKGKVIEESKAKPKKNAKSNKQARLHLHIDLEHCICSEALNLKPRIQAKKKQRHYFGAPMTSAPKLSSCFCLAALFCNLQRCDEMLQNKYVHFLADVKNLCSALSWQLKTQQASEIERGDANPKFALNVLSIENQNLKLDWLWMRVRKC